MPMHIAWAFGGVPFILLAETSELRASDMRLAVCFLGLPVSLS